MTTVTIPTASSIKLRFPEFATVEDAVIEFAIEEARLEFSTNWVTGYNLAIIYLVGEYVTRSVLASEGGGAGSGGEIASESIGRLSITYKTSTPAAAADSTDPWVSSYGRRYQELLERNFGGPVIL